MKKLLFIVFIIFLMHIPSFAQAFDDMPFSNPDRWTYFQQEMTSLMRFQIDNDTDTLLFMSTSVRFSTLKYKDYYLYSQYGKIIEEERLKGSEDLNMILGYQSKINNYLYIPFFWHIGQGRSYILLEDYEYVYYGAERKGPMYVEEHKGGSFFGGGVFLNTDVLNGGIYLGMASLDSNNLRMEYTTYDSIYDNMPPPPSFRIALVPLVNTSAFNYLGKVLTSVFGYLGLGDNIITSAEAQEDIKFNTFLTSLNAALNFTFNRIDFGSLSLSSELLYSRGNFDAAAKTDTYGIKVSGLFSETPFGFILTGGYKHFFSVSEFFLSDYSDTIFYNGTIFFKTQQISYGIIYHYDNIYKSKVTFALSIYPEIASSGFALSVIDMSGFWSLNPARQYMDEEIMERYLSFDLGARYRFGFKNRKK